jgi:hypothetical protein
MIEGVRTILNQVANVQIINMSVAFNWATKTDLTALELIRLSSLPPNTHSVCRLCGRMVRC